MTNNETLQPADGRGNVELDKATLRKVFFRWYFFSQANWNYEKMQGAGYCFSMFPVLKKVYGDDDEAMHAAVANHLQFFNSSPQATPGILGINSAVESRLGSKGTEAIAGLKTGLMGPFAGVGDSLFGVVLQTVCGSLAAYQALEGSPVGCLIYLAVGFAMMAVRWTLFKIGYTQGERAVDTITEHLKPITECASVLGLTVVGAMITTVISISLSGTYVMGDLEKPIQGMLDGILPGMLPLIAVALVYMLLSRKGMTSNKVIAIVCALGLILGCTGFFA
ncbi:PTS system mannose/fructose/sorbose family transporter subunit IID [Collinsella vaginalis]|uniref:PTS system mannose/fructose/sorbose family transporter subunit IID n=1 Tax=Collinsella vaginalis TaxID=1870987 RepID=UPI000A26FA11|nr:PTS system mannose/fructose/sorbose family transporter subunit IID [Collinsella vaginalis]